MLNSSLVGTLHRSVVSKQTGGDGKEDLKMDTLAVTIEGEDIEDPSLKVPGKLLV